MGRNGKNFGAGPDVGGRFVRSNPSRTPSPAPKADDIARDMTLLSKLVMKRRYAGIERTAVQDRQDFSGENSGNLRNLAFEPIEISLDDDGEVQIVDSVTRAVECLTTQWPVRYGEAFEDALHICIDGIAGRASPQQVRSAFIAAAKAAGILVNSE